MNKERNGYMLEGYFEVVINYYLIKNFHVGASSIEEPIELWNFHPFGDVSSMKPFFPCSID